MKKLSLSLLSLFVVSTLHGAATINIRYSGACGTGYLSNDDRGVVHIVATAGAGITSGTYNVALEQSNDGGTTWFNVTSVNMVVAGSTISNNNQKLFDHSAAEFTSGTSYVGGHVLFRTKATQTAIYGGGTSDFIIGCQGSQSGAGVTQTQDIAVVLGAPAATGKHNVNYNGGLAVKARSNAHTLTLKANGATIATQSATANSAVDQTLSITGTYLASSGDTLAWFVDGVQQGPTFTAANQSCTSDNGSGCSIETMPSLAVGISDAAPSPTPVATAPPSPSPTPTAYATPPTGTTPPTTQIQNNQGGQTVTSNAVTVVNPQDIYKPITDALSKQLTPKDIYQGTKDALNDSAASSQSSSVDTTFNAGSTPSGLDNTNLNAITGNVNNSDTQARGQVTAGKALLSNSNALSLPSVTTSSLVFPITLPKLGSTNVDLTPYSAYIQLFRNLVLLMLYIWFWFLSAHCIRFSIA